MSNAAHITTPSTAASTSSMDNMDQQAVTLTTAPNTDQNATASGSITDFVDQATATAAIVIDQVKKEQLQAKFQETINNPRFWAKTSRYVALVSALSVPVFDDMSLQLFYLHARNDLIKDAAELSSNTGAAVVMPTEEAVIEEVWNRWRAKEEEAQIKALNKKRREDAKNNGPKYKAATSDDVKDIVAEAETKLRAEEGC